MRYKRIFSIIVSKHKNAGLSRNITAHVSSEKRRIMPQAFESEVPSLKVR